MVSADLNAEVEGKVAALRSAIQANDVGRMKQEMQGLNEAMQKIGEAVYKQQPPPGGQQPPPGEEGGQQQPPPPPPPGGGGEGTVEGEFREV